MKIHCEVVYASPDKQCLVSIELDQVCTLEEVIQRSGLLSQFPEIDLQKQQIGVFSQIKSLSDMVSTGDRIEIYRLLLIDPKEARRSKAKKKRT